MTNMKHKLLLLQKNIYYFAYMVELDHQSSVVAKTLVNKMGLNT